jgi:hypothetical protein
MKNFTLLALIFTAMALLSLLLPYERHDVESWNLFSGSTGIHQFGVNKPGYTLPVAYVPGFLMLLIWGMITLRKNLATAIIGLIFSALSLFYMAFLSFILTFNLHLFGGSTNSALEPGYYICLLAVISFLIVSIVHLTAVVRRPKRLPQPNQSMQDELLDS